MTSVFQPPKHDPLKRMVDGASRMSTEKSTKFSEFIRNATDEERARVYGEAMEKACEMQKGNSALLSPCRTYRYDLWRRWMGGSGYAMFVGLNPSTADETQDDPTIRRCVAFAKAWGYAGLCMTNLFAFRATNPADMMRAADPIGALNDDVLRDRAAGAAVVVAAWGVHGTFGGRHRAVRAAIPSLHYLRLTKDGHPGHPLYLPKHMEPTKWV